MTDSPTILFEDNHLLVMNKPAGMLSQGDRTGDESALDWGKAYIKHTYNKPGKVYLGLVHRLDRPVGGVMVFARTSKAAARLSAAFRERHVEKSYWALVEQRPEPQEGMLTHHLKRGQGGRPTEITEDNAPQASRAQLHYRYLGPHNQFHLLEIKPITGRKHQIRVQLAGIGLPILGDRKYGSTAPFPRKSIALYAKHLKIPHPISREMVTFEADLPNYWPR